jgi:hypothetical protein
MSQKKIDWEILDPQLQTQINNLNKNIINLTKENKDLKENFNLMKDEMIKLNLENAILFKQIKEFLEIGRIKYLEGFDKLNQKMNILQNNYENKLTNIENNIKEHNNNVFDPNYQMRINNIRWRNTSSNKNYINNPL